MDFDFASLSPQMRYKILSATVTPRPIAWVTTLDADDRLNAAPFSFFNAVSEDPPIIAFSILSRSPQDGKDTGRNVRTQREFVVNLVSEDTLERMNITATDFEPEIDEVTEAGLTSAPSVFIKTPRILESPVAFECILFEIIEIGALRSLILGEVRVAHVVDEAVLEAARGYVDSPALKIVGRGGPNSYIRTSEVITLPGMSVQEWRSQEAPLA